MVPIPAMTSCYKTQPELLVNISQHKIKLIYGGAKLGIMGIVADAALKFGAEVVGVIPGF